MCTGGENSQQGDQATSGNAVVTIEGMGGMQHLTKEEVLKQVRENNVKFIRLQFSDILGVFKNVAITVEELPKALEGRLTCDSSVIDVNQQEREQEIYLLPDPATFVIFPWRPRDGAVARLICDLTNRDGTPYECCSRSILRRVVEKSEADGLRMMVGTKNDFYLFKTGEDFLPTTQVHDNAGYYALFPRDLGENARRDMVLTLEEMGVAVSASNHEMGPGQHEISLKYDDALTMADKLTTFRFVVRTIASRHNLHASFMPLPMNGNPGSGLRMYYTAYKGLDNVFAPARGEQFSPLALQFVAGVLENAAAMFPVTNPLVNSYKRLNAGPNRPAFLGWSYDRRDTIVRLPIDKGEDTKVEVGHPDSACNPYLALALMIKAGVEGFKGQLVPDPPIEQVSPDTLRVPDHLGDAIKDLKRADLFRNTVGSAFADHYEAAKVQEWERYNRHVHQWEVEEYLEIF